MEKDERRVGLLHSLDSVSLSIYVLGIKGSQKGDSRSNVHICSLYIYIYMYQVMAVKTLSSVDIPNYILDL